MIDYWVATGAIAGTVTYQFTKNTTTAIIIAVIIIILIKTKKIR